jgi:hypothetical protein
LRTRAGLPIEPVDVEVLVERRVVSCIVVPIVPLRMVVESRIVVSREVVGVCVGLDGAGVCAAAAPALMVRAIAAPMARVVMNRIVITSILQIAAEAAGSPNGRRRQVSMPPVGA